MPLITSKHQKILFCVLNWGLGHASRSVPFVRELKQRGHDVFIASDGDALVFLKAEFPDERFIELPGYNVEYTFSPTIGTLLSLPGINKAIKREGEAVNRFVQANNIDLVISDNRYGCVNQEVTSYLITHQLNPFVGVKNKVVRNFAQRQLAKYINRFSACLVPDLSGEGGICGELTVNSHVAIPITHIGFLTAKSLSHSGAEKKPPVLAIISGPEPNRSSFESYLCENLKGIDCRIVCGKVYTNTSNCSDAGGSSAADRVSDIPEQVQDRDTFFQIDNWSSSKELNDLLDRAEVVVCRSGYSSVMDLLALGKKAVFVPTPNMPEQEYLVNQLKEYRQFICLKEGERKIKVAIEELNNRPNPEPGEANKFIGVF